MNNRMARQVIVSFLALNLLTAGVGHTAFAAMIGTQDAIEFEQRSELVAGLQNELAREDVRSQFLALGVDPQHVNQRLDQLTDQELRELSSRIDDMPAGAGVVGVLGVVFIVLLVLEFIGVIDIFKRI